MRIQFLLICLTIITQISFPQQKKIIRIIDSNLFELQNGDLIKLAGVDAPRKNHPDYALRQVADKAIQYAKDEFLNRKFTLILLENSLTPEYELAYLIKEHVFGDKDLNKSFLENGFGKFINNVDSLHFIEYKLVENNAKESNKGIWKFGKFEDSVILDREFPELEKDFVSTDSLQYMYLTQQPPNGLIVLSELLLGPTVGLITVIPGALIGGGLYYALGGRDGWSGLGVAFIGSYFGFLAGNSYGVYAIAKNTNKDVNYWYTFLSSFTGTVLGISIAVISQDKIPALNASPFILPTISSIIYSNIIAGDKFQSVTSENQIRINSYSSHQDIYNSQLIFNINLIHFSF